MHNPPNLVSYSNAPYHTPHSRPRATGTLSKRSSSTRPTRSKGTCTRHSTGTSLAGYAPAPTHAPTCAHTHTRTHTHTQTHRHLHTHAQTLAPSMHKPPNLVSYSNAPYHTPHSLPLPATATLSKRSNTRPTRSKETCTRLSTDSSRLCTPLWRWVRSVPPARASQRAPSSRVCVGACVCVLWVRMARIFSVYA